jgi:hypothetical protein
MPNSKVSVIAVQARPTAYADRAPGSDPRGTSWGSTAEAKGAGAGAGRHRGARGVCMICKAGPGALIMHVGQPGLAPTL